ncbi:hypothetical protein Nepgr_000262 [Nepenthes gracilis]|uniref:Transcription repressor n=1 Tax=Nepenthes gracilis TaxID=150966 RepID=A0AAD3P3A3_NEPGR|nr:hypothetical protein Nepgr_000262 [Nepenthes gracilis]
MSPNKRRILKSLFAAGNLRCGCGRSTLPNVYQPKPKSESAHGKSTDFLYPSSSSSCDKLFGGDEGRGDDNSTTTFSHNIDSSESPAHCSDAENDPNCSRTVSSPTPSCSKISESIAVVKESKDPYLDFRQSMLQMIFEKEIYSREDLQELLTCFLQLNSPSHHDLIIEAFTEIWNGMIFVNSITEPEEFKSRVTKCSTK